MAWRLSRFQSFVSGTTTLTKAFVDALQDAIADLFNGAYSVKKLLVDAVGDQAATYATGVIAYITGGALRIEGASGDTNQAGQSDTIPTVRKCWWRWQLSSGVYARIYYEGNFISFTINAEWGGATWTHDSGGAAVESLRVEIGAGGFIVRRKAAGSAAWADGTWVTVASIDEVTAAIFTIGTVTGSTGVTATTGDVTATAGNVVATGTVVGSAGPGLLKGKRIYGSGTAVVNGDFTLSAGWGNTGAVASSGGTDMACYVECSSNGAGIAANPTVTFTFHSGTFTNPPLIWCSLSAPTAADSLPIKWTVSSATTCILTYLGTPAAGVALRFHFNTVGV